MGTHPKNPMHPINPSSDKKLHTAAWRIKSNFMDSLVTQNWILLVSAVIVIFGWQYTSKKERENAVFLKRLEFRAQAFRSFLDVVNFVRDHTDENGQVQINQASDLKKFKMLVQGSMDQFNLYCNPDEREAMNRLAVAWQSASKSKDGGQIVKEIGNISNLVVQQSRADLRIPNSEAS